MNIVIFGAKGQLGRDLVATFAESGTVHPYDLPELDIADASAVDDVLGKQTPDLVINAAAYTDVEAAEDNETAAFGANETGARNIAGAAARIGAPVVYYSTDYVFGGKKNSPYEIDDMIAPIGVYGRSKCAGEVATREHNGKHYIVRTAWLYGLSGNCFPEKIIRAASERPELKVVDDEIGSPTHTLDLAEATLHLTRTDAFGIYHTVNEGSCSRYTFAKRILEFAGIATPVNPCSSAEFETKAERPQYSVLSNAALETASGHRMRSWEDALEHYMKRR